ncbi:FHA domain-containing protein [Streptomyces sp. NBC_00989]|uniref:FHA domain-containing protein n=1 Tax=Streptomyces sp. NBC_00989 TaxID=2903705 RepID=UPI0038646623|nr:FHA domain-containing protein [Streptomyces sp. NBC_00989]
MQIRLTVVDPLGPPAQPRGRSASCDVLVTAPAGTALAAVASALASAVSADAAASQSERSRESGGPIVLYAGVERLDTQRCTLGEPPLTDGAVVSLGAPAEPEAHPELDDAPTQLHVVAGPDAGGVHLLHGGQIHIGRSADADVPLDDPDVSRLHCAVTVDPSGRVSVADLGSTNGTTLAGTRVGTRPVRFAPGALLRIGESALRLTPSGGPGARAETAPDGEGHVRVSPGTPAAPRGEPLVVPGQAGAPSIEHRGVHDGGDTHAGRFGVFGEALGTEEPEGAEDVFSAPTTTSRIPPHDDDSGAHSGRKGTPLRGTDVPPGVRRRGGIGKWARRLTGGRGESTAEDTEPAYDGSYDEEGADESVPPPPVVLQQPDTWPDPAALLLTALGPGPRLWERTPGHPEALTVRLGTADRATPDGSALLPAVPVTSGLREVGALGLAGPRARLSGLARAVVAQLAALHSPDALEIVLISTDRARTVAERTAEWSWLGWLPHLRPGHGQDCRLLLAYDREQATARTDELLRRLEDHAMDARGGVRVVGGGTSTFASGAMSASASGASRRTTGIGAQRASAEGQLGSGSRYGSADGPSGLASPHGSLASQHGSAEGQLGAAARRVTAASSASTAYPTPDDAHHHRSGTADRPGAESVAPHAVDDPASGATRPRSSDARPAGTAAAHSGSGARTTPAATAPHGADDSADSPRGAAHRPAWARTDDGDGSADGFVGPYTVLVVDGDPGGADVREAVARLAHDGPRAGIHVVCLAETEAASPVSPVTETYEAACAAAPTFRECGAVALLSGDVATALRLLRVAHGGTGPSRPGTGAARSGTETSRPGTATSPLRTEPSRLGRNDPDHAHPGQAGLGRADPDPSGPGPAGPGPVGNGTIAAVDAVSLAWAERFARALAPLRADGPASERHARVSAPLPQSARLLDELGLARATPASLLTRWADAGDDKDAIGGRAWAVLGAGPRGPVSVDLATEGPHLLIEGPPGSGRTESLRAVVASLAAAERPDRLGIVLMDGRDSVGAGGPSSGGGGHGEGLRVCTDVPHVTTHLTANDPVRMREFAQSLSAELKRRAELLGRIGFVEWHSRHEVSGRIIAQRGTSGAGDLDSPTSSTIRLRPSAAARQQTEAAPPLPRLVVVVDDLDALVRPPLGSPGRPAAGSVIRALEAVAREGERLGVHLVAAAAVEARTAETEPARHTTLRVSLDPTAQGPEEPAPGRGRLTLPDGRATPFQGGRVTGRIPRTATLRPTVVPLEWQRMGDPPARRPVRELGNGPTDLALLASALERATRSVSAAEVPSLL